MIFRDDRDALLARNDALEEEVERLRRERDEARAPAPPAPVAPPVPEPAAVRTPKPRRVRPARARGGEPRYPWWVLVILVPTIAGYGVALVDVGLTLATGRDAFGVPLWGWFPGCLIFAVWLGFTGTDRRAGTTPRWLYVLVLVHLLYFVGALVVTIALGAANVYALQGLGTLFLALVILFRA